MTLTRRRLLGGSLFVAASGLPWPAFGVESMPRGGTLIVGAGPEATSGLTSAVTSAGTAQLVSGKIFDGLLTYDEHFNPKPQLATQWEVAGAAQRPQFLRKYGAVWEFRRGRARQVIGMNTYLYMEKST